MRTSFRCRGRRIGWAATVLVVASIAFAALAAEDDTVVDIPDPALRAAIESALDKEADAPITVAEMESLTSLGATRTGIADLTGLEHATGLTTLALWGNRIRDVTPLAGLTSLTRLYLSTNSITDVTPLAGLTSLTDLRLDFNQIADVTPLAGLTSLTGLHLQSNRKVADVTPLAGLTSLTELYLQRNQIADVTSLADMTSLTRLWLDGNQIADVTPLADMTSLTDLRLGANQITDVTPLAGMASLTQLWLYSNQIADVTPLADMTSLTLLWLANNQIADVTPLAGLTNLETLRLGWNRVSDGSPLAALTRLSTLGIARNDLSSVMFLARLVGLQHLEIHVNRVSDLSPLAELEGLQNLNIGGNGISDISPLSGLVNLRYLYAMQNDISNISPLAGLPYLSVVYLVSNQITDLSALRDAVNLTTLSLPENRISDLSPLSGLVGLRTLFLSRNHVTDLSPLAGLPSLTNLNVGSNANLSDLSPLATLTGLSQLFVPNTSVSDLSPLASVASLRNLDVSYTGISDISSLPTLTNVTYLSLNGNRIADLSPVRQLEGLVSLSAWGNQVEDLSFLSGLSQLGILNLGGNDIADVGPLDHMTGLRFLALWGNEIVDVAPIAPILDDGDEVLLWSNPLGDETIDVHIPAMTTNGVTVVDELRAHGVPLVSAGSDAQRQGFVRVTNHETLEVAVGVLSNQGAPFIWVRAVDDDAHDRWSFLNMREFDVRSVGSFRNLRSIHLNSRDFEEGSDAKGFLPGSGTGNGDWRLEFHGDLDFEVAAYMRTRDGFLTSMHDVAPQRPGGHWVAIFNPGSNDDQVSSLRVVNAGREPANVTISGIDDHGQSPGSGVSATVPAGSSRTFTAAQLEAGGAGMIGALGDGEGKWQLNVVSDQPVDVLSLMASPTGHLTNLSTVPANATATSGGETLHRVPLFPPAGDAHREGFARVINHGSVAGTIRIDAYDDAGTRHGPVTLAVPAGRTVHFNSRDLEMGNADKGLPDGVGSGSGRWHLDLATTLHVTVLSYARTPDGFLTAMHDTAPEMASDPTEHRYRVPIFNPGSNDDQVSRLRLVNPGTQSAVVTISGIDDHGESPGSDVRVTVPAQTARALTAQQLESGDGVDGTIGDGQGKWELAVASDRPLMVMSLLSSPTGHLTNLSTAPGRPPGSEHEDAAPSMATGVPDVAAIRSPPAMTFR